MPPDQELLGWPRCTDVSEFDHGGAAARVGWIRRHLGSLGRVPSPGSGATVRRFRALAAIAGLDGSLGRLAEGHLDALAIVDELGPLEDLSPSAVWGVWAARPELVVARPTPGGWRLVGTKPWCSGAELIDQALVTAVDPDGRSRLFSVAVRDMTFDDDWHPLGMEATASCTGRLDLELSASDEVGPPDGYVGRPGFWHGGMGVAACWHGLATRVSGELAAHARAADDPFARAAAGQARAEVTAARALLTSAARRIDARPRDEALARGMAGVVRVAVERSSRAVADHSITTQGAGALCFDAPHATAVADLVVYLRQLKPALDASMIELGPDDTGWWSS